MSIEENLTYLQKAAIKGEIAFALSTAAHNAEMKYRVYLILKEVDEKYKGLILSCVKESITGNKDDIDRIYLEVLNNTVPVWLWVDEIIADIKLHLNTAEAGLSVLTGSRLDIDKSQERKNIIESAFIFFAREAMMISPDATEQLLDKIQNDYDLEFLHNACFYLKNGCPEVRELKKDRAHEIPEEIMSCLFDVKRILSFSIESKALSILNKAEKKANKRYQEITKQPLPTEDIQEEIGTTGTIIESNSITHEQLSQYISDKIAELFEGVVTSTPKTNSADTVYVVKKVFTDSGLSTDIRICRTKEEAIDFVKKIIREYPELANTCEFQVHTENLHDREKNKWGPKTN